MPIEESGRLQFVPVPHQELPEGPLASSQLTNNISIRFVNGHTRAMMLPQIKYGEKTIVFVADLLPSIAHIPIPYVMGYDMFPLTTLHEKRSFLSEALANDYILFFEHDPKHECCTLQQTEKGTRERDLFRLGDVLPK